MIPIGKEKIKMDSFDFLKPKEEPSFPGPGTYEVEAYRTIAKKTEKKIDITSGIP